jgi:hypothetical protein
MEEGEEGLRVGAGAAEPGPQRTDLGGCEHHAACVSVALAEDLSGVLDSSQAERAVLQGLVLDLHVEAVERSTKRRTGGMRGEPSPQTPP